MRNVKYSRLGNTNINVSKLCFGSLTISSLQSNLELSDGVKVIKKAFEEGINFIDTAELYRNYCYIRNAIKGLRQNIIVSTKCYAYTKQGAEESLKRAMEELETDYIDIFSLHEQESDYTIKGHYDAIEYFIKAKEKGYIRAFGISTHNIAAVLASLKYNEIEVIHPIYNRVGLGIVDGSIDEMEKAIKLAYKNGKGIYSMKPLGGGNLLNDIEESLKFVMDKDFLHSIALGMQTEEEVIFNSYFFKGKEINKDIKLSVKKKKRKLLIDFWCEGCGDCIAACSQGALSIIDNRAVVDNNKCILCGYCSRYCKQFCIKVI